MKQNEVERSHFEERTYISSSCKQNIPDYEQNAL